MRCETPCALSRQRYPVLMTRTELLRRLLANRLAAQMLLDVRQGRDLDECFDDLIEEGERLEREDAPEETWVDGGELWAAWERVCPPPVEVLDWRDVPPPY
jgi:hypothetical protein